MDTAPQTVRRRRPATHPRSAQFDFVGGPEKVRYRLQVALPYAPPPATGYPVILVLDGGAYFGAFAEAARLRCAVGAELAPAIVAGIGYAAGDLAESMRRRYRDLSPTPQDAESAAFDAATMGPAEGGGADAFAEVIESKVRPRIAGVAPIDPARVMLFGHSLGGLFALHTLFTRPEAFSDYLALSPSIWWNRRVVLDHEEVFRR